MDWRELYIANPTHSLINSEIMWCRTPQSLCQYYKHACFPAQFSVDLFIFIWLKIFMRVPLSAAGWRNDLRDNLEDLVQSVNHLAIHGSQLARYILIQELGLDAQFFSRLQDQFRPNEKQIDEFAAFFDTCLMSLATAIKIAVRVFSRSIVQQYVEAYQQAAGIGPI
ncbi:hypothetical protein BX667DRAFT_191703 [Coemansia mojavensis]|nr:hypothetical protein BX667DRAFT_191703 [Coemansia mojavensis]